MLFAKVLANLKPCTAGSNRVCRAVLMVIGASLTTGRTGISCADAAFGTTAARSAAQTACRKVRSIVMLLVQELQAKLPDVGLARRILDDDDDRQAAESLAGGRFGQGDRPDPVVAVASGDDEVTPAGFALAVGARSEERR